MHVGHLVFQLSVGYQPHRMEKILSFVQTIPTVRILDSVLDLTISL